jgi:hypothetical protein
MKRIFATLESRLPAGATEDSRNAVKAIGEMVAAFKKGADAIAKDARYSEVGKRDAIAGLKKSATETGPLAEMRADYARRAGNIAADQDNMRRRALGVTDIDPVAAMRREMRDAETRSLLRGIPLAERLKAALDPEIARSVASSTPLLSGLPPDVHKTIVEDLTDKAIAAKFGERAAEFAAAAEELEAISSAIQLAADMIERE